MRKLTGIVLGAILIACGVVYLLGVYGLADIQVSLDGWWTLFLILPCLSGLFTGEDKLGNLVGLALGVLLLMAARGVLDYERVWKSVIPLILVVIGIRVIARSLSAREGRETPAVPGGKTEHMAVLAAQRFDCEGEEMGEAKLGAVFGGVECDLTRANIQNGSRADVLCVFGGVDLFLPETVQVKNNAFCLFGGFSDERPKKADISADTTLTINGLCLFGGVSLK